MSFLLTIFNIKVSFQNSARYNRKFFFGCEKCLAVLRFLVILQAFGAYLYALDVGWDCKMLLFAGFGRVNCLVKVVRSWMVICPCGAHDGDGWLTKPYVWPCERLRLTMRKVTFWGSKGDLSQRGGICLSRECEAGVPLKLRRSLVAGAWRRGYRVRLSLKLNPKSWVVVG